MFSEFLQALFKAGLPVAACTYILTYWSLHRGYLQRTDSLDELQKELDAMGKGEKPASKDPLYNKWVKFGGGFYGVIALITLWRIEWADFRDFIAEFPGIATFIQSLSLDWLISLAIDLFMDFIAAITWPVYWLSRIDSRNVWLWLLAAYTGYYLGTRLAHLHSGKPNKSEVP